MHTEGIERSRRSRKASNLWPLHGVLQPTGYLLAAFTVGSVFGAQGGCQGAKPQRAFVGPSPRQHEGMR